MKIWRKFKKPIEQNLKPQIARQTLNWKRTISLSVKYWLKTQNELYWLNIPSVFFYNILFLPFI